ncbi:MAG TPA: sugar ABC transporter permease [Ruminiclostridium sp.]
MAKVLSNKLAISLLVVPGMLLFLFAVFVPIVMSCFYALTDFQGIGNLHFIGLENFKQILTNDTTFYRSLLNALLLALAFIFLQHPLSLTFAIILDKLSGKFEKIFRVIIFIPCVISVMVNAKMWVNIFDSQFGLLNKVLDLLGLGVLKTDWLGNPHTALPSILFVNCWMGFGWAVMIYYAGVKGISEEMYEAAKIDGASAFKLYTKILIPLLKPVISMAATLAVINALKTMEVPFLMTNGGPGDYTQFIANYLYTKAFSDSQYGYGNAVSVIFVAVCLLGTLISNKITNSGNYE